MRWAAATRKWPEPQAGSQTVSARKRGLGVGGLLGVVEHRVEGRVEQAVDQRRRGVVGAGRLALVAGDGLEGEGARSSGRSGARLEQRLVDAAELLGAEVAVVDDCASARRRPAARSQVRGSAASRARWRAAQPVTTSSSAGVEEAAEAGQRQLGPAVRRGRGRRATSAERLPEVGVAAAAAAAWRGAAGGRWRTTRRSAARRAGRAVGVERAGRGPRRRSRTAAGRRGAAGCGGSRGRRSSPALERGRELVVGGVAGGSRCRGTRCACCDAVAQSARGRGSRSRRRRCASFEPAVGRAAALACRRARTGLSVARAGRARRSRRRPRRRTSPRGRTRRRSGRRASRSRAAGAGCGRCDRGPQVRHRMRLSSSWTMRVRRAVGRPATPAVLRSRSTPQPSRWMGQRRSPASWLRSGSDRSSAARPAGRSSAWQLGR